MPRRPYPRSDRRGASKVEYGLLAGLLAVGAITAVDGVGGSVANLLDDSAGAVENAVAGIGGDGGNDGGNDGGGAGSAPDVAEIVGVSADGGPAFFAGDQITIHVDYDEPVDVTGAPTFRLDLDSGPVDAVYAGGDGTDRISFSYTLQAGDADADGADYGDPLSLSGGSIVSTGAGLDADLDPASGTLADIVVVATLTETAIAESWRQPSLDPNSPQFGRYLDISGGLLFTGAPGMDISGNVNYEHRWGNLFLHDAQNGDEIHDFAFDVTDRDASPLRSLVDGLSYPGDIEVAWGAGASINNGWAVAGSLNAIQDPDNHTDDVALVQVVDVATRQIVRQLHSPDLPNPVNAIYGGRWENQFGTTVAISGNYAVIGDPLANLDGDDGYTFNQGRAYLFDLRTGELKARLNHSGQAVGNTGTHPFAGAGIAMHGDIAVIGAYLYDLSAAKASTVPVKMNETLNLAENFPPPVPDDFSTGWSVDMDAAHVVSGGWSNGRREVHVFAKNGSYLRTIQMPSWGASDAEFGQRVSVSNGQIAVTYRAHYQNDADFHRVLIFDADTGNLTHQLVPSHATGIDEFARADVAIDNGLVAVSNVAIGQSAPQRVYLYDLR